MRKKFLCTFYNTVIVYYSIFPHFAVVRIIPKIDFTIFVQSTLPRTLSQCGKIVNLNSTFIWSYYLVRFFPWNQRKYLKSDQQIHRATSSKLKFPLSHGNISWNQFTFLFWTFFAWFYKKVVKWNICK